METIRFEAQVRGAIKWDDDAKVYVSYAPALGIYSQGISSKEAQEALKSAIQLYLQTAYNENIFDKKLKRFGFAVVSSPEGLGSAEETITVLKEQAFTEFFDVPAVLVLASP